MTAVAEAAPPRTAASVRPTDGTCSHWIGADLRYCRAADGVRQYLPGHRCPAHTPAALAGLPEPPPGPGIPAYNRTENNS